MSPAGRGKRRPPSRQGSTRRSPSPPKGATGPPLRGRSSTPRGKVGSGKPPAKRTGSVGGEQVEGHHAVRELLMAGTRAVQEIWVLADADRSGALADIIEIAAAERVPVKEVGRGRFFAEARCEAPQGVLAKAAPLRETDLDVLATRGRSGRPPFLLAVDGVTDPGNLGALLRSAECAGVSGVVLPRHRAVHVTPTVTKAAAGAVEHLPFCVVGGLPAALSRLREHDVWVVGLDGGADTGLWELPAADTAVALVLGAEGTGLSRLVRQRCDELVAIPLLGRLASLNVAAAGALACYEVARCRADLDG
jgi:23S rRNA (guanosine2251-2'-O)-methyltransferase